MRRTTPLFLAPLFLLILAAVVSAHPGHGGTQGWANGFAHPFTGVDHILAMLAVGMWSAQPSSAGRWRIPMVFLAMMAAGAGLALLRFPLPMVESGILASVLVLGMAVLFAFQVRVVTASLLVGLFALFHGYAHFAEMPTGGSAMLYAGGFLCASALLIAGGIAIAQWTASLRRPQWLRACGGAIATLGFVLIALA